MLHFWMAAPQEQSDFFFFFRHRVQELVGSSRLFLAGVTVFLRGTMMKV